MSSGLHIVDKCLSRSSKNSSTMSVDNQLEHDNEQALIKDFKADSENNS